MAIGWASPNLSIMHLQTGKGTKKALKNLRWGYKIGQILVELVAREADDEVNKGLGLMSTNDIS